MLDVAKSAAEEAGKVLSEVFEIVGMERELKEDKSFVTVADKKSEEIIVSRLTAAFPDHGILGEEGHNINPGAEFQWVIDPLDGTANFVNGIPIFAISIGLVRNGEPYIGVIYNPVTRSLYAGEKGKGVTYNGKETKVSKQEADKGVVTIGYGGKDKARARNLPGKASAFFKSTRILGSCSLELGYLARGGTEGFICMSLSKWDFAAGALLVQEAGGKITTLDDKPWTLETNSFIASNGVAHPSLVKLVALL